MDWTEEQKRAIELRGKNILVAAAAGSGKTAVLVERIKRLILEDKASIDRMLIVTFTNAAASEMKEKIHRAINQTIEEMTYAGDDETLAFLKQQINLLPMANISTFHAFALEIIKKYFHVIGVEPDFRICDDAQQALLKSEAMDDLLEEYFVEDSREFYDFLDKYSGDRNEDRFRDMVDSVYSTIQSLPEPYEWLHEKVEMLRGGTGGEDDSEFDFIWEIAEDKISSAMKTIEINLRRSRELGLAKGEELAGADMAQLRELESALGDYDRMQSALAAFKLPVMSKKIFENIQPQAKRDSIRTSMGKNRDSVKKDIGSLRSSFFAGGKEALAEEMALTYDDARFLEKVVLRYGEIFGEKKKEKNLVDFGDIEHYAYEILKDDEVSRFYREKFDHIFVDEYQDSNVIQEAFVDRIKRDNNLFLVGDVKQSIYKFRLAEPEIFQRRYALYAEGEGGLSEKIELNSNFRSKRPVIDFINQVFDFTMEGYDDNAALHMGDVCGDRYYAEPVLCLAQVPWDEGQELDDELKSMMKAEKEALAAVKIIRDSLGQPIFDSKAGTERSLKLQDIVILMRGVKNYGDIFYHILTENGISAYVDDSDGYFDTLEINNFLCLLSILDNYRQDVPLLTVLRSEIFGFTVEELAQIRINCREGTYAEAFEACCEAEASGENDELKAKCIMAKNALDEWRELAVFMPLEELVWKLMLDTGFYLAMGAMPGGRQRQANLRALVDKALNFRRNQGGSLYEFIRYIEAVKTHKVASGQVKLVSENDDLVRIMTVHKSKGLEFPMVILAGYCRKLNYTSMGRSLVIHKDLGIGFPIVNHRENWYRTTALQSAIKEKFHREEVEEEKRVLYVAMTRAMDRLVLLGICDDVQGEIDKAGSEAPKDTSYFTMTGNRICTGLGQYEKIEDASLAGLVKGQKRAGQRAMRLFGENGGSSDDRKNGEGEETDRDVAGLLEFAYPNSEELTVKSKYSVSELNSENLQMPGNLPEPACFNTGKTFTPAQRGTICHCVLEHLDFRKARMRGPAEIEETIQRLTDDMFITPEEAGTVEADNLLRLVNSRLGQRLADSPAVYRERQFNLMDKVNGCDVIIQGIIDCYFEEGDDLILIDYKTSRIHSSAGSKAMQEEKRRIAERYATQIEIYRKALETISGRKVREAYIYLTDCGEVVEM